MEAKPGAKEKDMANLRTERVMIIRVMCGMKLMDRSTMELRVDESLDMMAKASSM